MINGGRITIETANKWLGDRGVKERALGPGQCLSICVTGTGTIEEPDIPQVGSGETVLVIDDELTVHMLISDVLSEA